MDQTAEQIGVEAHEAAEARASRTGPETAAEQLGQVNRTLERIALALEQLTDEMSAIAKANGLLIQAISDASADEAPQAGAAAGGPYVPRTMDDPPLADEGANA